MMPPPTGSARHRREEQPDCANIKKHPAVGNLLAAAGFEKLATR